MKDTSFRAPSEERAAVVPCLCNPRPGPVASSGSHNNLPLPEDSAVASVSECCRLPCNLTGDALGMLSNNLLTRTGMGNDLGRIGHSLCQCMFGRGRCRCPDAPMRCADPCRAWPCSLDNGSARARAVTNLLWFRCKADRHHPRVCRPCARCAALRQSANRSSQVVSPVEAALVFQGVLQSTRSSSGDARRRPEILQPVS